MSDTDTDRSPDELQLLHDFLKVNEEAFRDFYIGMDESTMLRQLGCKPFEDFQVTDNPTLLSQFLGDCVWKARPSPGRLEQIHPLLSLLELRNNVSYEVLRLLWYIYSAGLPEDIASAGDFRTVFGEFCDEDLSEDLVLHEGGYSLACDFLILALLEQKSKLSPGHILFLLDLVQNKFLIDATTSLLCYISRFPKTFKAFMLPEERINCLSQEQFELFLEISACGKPPQSLLNTIWMRLEAFEMDVPMRSAAFLEKDTRIVSFMEFFAASQYLNKALWFVVQALKSMFVNHKSDDPFQTLQNVFQKLALEHLPVDTVVDCEDSLRSLFELQFKCGQFNENFTSAYLERVILSGEQNTESNPAVLAKVRDFVLCATTSSASQSARLLLLFRYFEGVLNGCTKTYVFSEKISSLLIKCSALFPEIREDMAGIVASTMHALEELASTVSRENGYKIMKTIAVLNECLWYITDMHYTDATEVQELMSVIERYNQCIQRVPGPDQKTLLEISNECKSRTCGFGNWKVIEAEYSDDNLLRALPWSLIEYYVELLAKNLAHWENNGFRKMWQNHAFLCLEFCRFPLFQLLLRTEQNILLRRAIATVLIYDFQKESQLDCDIDMRSRLLKDKQTIIRLALSDFQIPEDREQINMIETVLSSSCLQAALKARKTWFSRNIQELYRNKIYFADLTPEVFGLTLFGGYILLNREYLTKESLGESVLMLVLSHELAHAERCFAREGVSDLEMSRSLQSFPNGVSGLPQLRAQEIQEGGDFLEATLFGVQLPFLSEAQVHFLTSGSNWNLGLGVFTARLDHFGAASKRGDITDQIFSLQPRRSCPARG